MVSEPTEGPNRAELLKLYELAIQEYRFQVLLNWDRAKHALVADGILLGVAAGLYKFGPTGTPSLVGVVFLFVFANSLFAAMGVRTGHLYYRATRRHVAELGARLGLPVHGLALVTTSGMVEDHDASRVPVAWMARSARFIGRITTHITALLILIAIASLVGAIVIFCS